MGEGSCSFRVEIRVFLGGDSESGGAERLYLHDTTFQHSHTDTHSHTQLTK